MLHATSFLNYEMKRFTIILWLCTLPIWVGCGDTHKELPRPIEEPRERPVFVENFVASFYEGDIALDPLMIYPEGKSPIAYGLRVHAADPLFNRTQSRQPAYKERQKELFALRGIPPFERSIVSDDWIRLCQTHLLAQNIRTITLTSEQAWDATHPAGTPLNDMLMASTCSVRDFVRSNYDTRGKSWDEVLRDKLYLTYHDCSLSELTAHDMELLMANDAVEIYFASAPTLERIHTLTLTWETTGNEVQTASVTLAPEVDLPEWFQR